MLMPFTIWITEVTLVPWGMIFINQRLKATGVYSPVDLEAEVGSEGVSRAESSSWGLGDRLGTS